jgi:negative regulator of sigma E activity
MADDSTDNQRDEESASAFRSYVALAFVAVLVAAAVWLVNSFREKNRTIECLEAGHHDCVPFDTSAKGGGG